MRHPFLSSIYDADELSDMAALNCSRTLAHLPEVTITPSLLCQPIDIAISAQGDIALPIANMTDYPMRSLENTCRYIAELLDLGIAAVMLRMDAPADMSQGAILERQCHILAQIRQQYPASMLAIIIDPFSLALNRDKTWGVMQDGALDYLATAELYSQLTGRFADAGADYIMTLGRFEREVDVAVRTLASMPGATTAVCSFSTNTETTNAYVYADHGAYALTKQKILVANYNEMTFRALIDVYEGTQMVVIKPAENLHVLERLKTLATHQALLTSFLQSSSLADLTADSPYLQEVLAEMRIHPEELARRLRAAKLSTYTVSGTYYMDMQIRERKGAAFLASALYERFVNAANVLQDGEKAGWIIDRNAAWFIEQRR